MCGQNGLSVVEYLACPSIEYGVQSSFRLYIKCDCLATEIFPIQYFRLEFEPMTFSGAASALTTVPPSYLLCTYMVMQVLGKIEYSRYAGLLLD